MNEKQLFLFSITVKINILYIFAPEVMSNSTIFKESTGFLFAHVHK